MPSRFRLAASAIGQVEGVDWPPDLLEIELAVIGGAHPHAGTVDDSFRHRAEAGAPVNTALQHDIAFLHRVDAEAREAVEVGGLDMARDEDDLDRAGVEHHTGA